MEKRTRDYKKNGSKKMSKQGKVLILALLAFLIFFVGFKIYHSKDVQASTIKLVKKYDIFFLLIISIFFLYSSNCLLKGT